MLQISCLVEVGKKDECVIVGMSFRLGLYVLRLCLTHCMICPRNLFRIPLAKSCPEVLKVYLFPPAGIFPDRSVDFVVAVFGSDLTAQQNCWETAADVIKWQWSRLAVLFVQNDTCKML